MSTPFDLFLHSSQIPKPDLAPPTPRDVERNITGAAIYVSRNLLGENITLNNSTPTIIRVASYAQKLLIVNPTRLDALTSAIQGATTAAAVASGNSQATPIDVAGFGDIHYHMNVTAIAGAWDLYVQTYDSLAGTWMDGQQIFAALGATGNYYALGGNIGIAEKIAFRWNMAVAGNITFTLNVVRKSGLGGNAQASTQIAYIGGLGVTTNSGYPIIEGGKETFILGEGVSLYAITNVSSLNIRIFQL